MAGAVSTDTQIDSMSPPAAANWDDYRVFVAVARAGNFYRAALELSTTQATVSRRIQALERALGLTLFDRPRGRGGVALTFDGRRILQEASAAELCLSRAQNMHDTRTGLEGDCKLLGTDGVANFWMPPFVRTLTRRHPGIQLKYFLTPDQSVNQRPPYDLQMQYAGATEADSVSCKLATLHLVLFASNDYICEYGYPASHSDFARHRILNFSSFVADEHNWAAYSLNFASQYGTLHSNSSALLVDLVLAGTGISMLPSYLFAVYPRLVHVLPDIHFKVNLFLNFHREAARKPPVRTVIDYLKEEVFNPRRMPWFQEAFQLPDADWPRLYRNITAEASPKLPARMVG